MKTLGVGHTGFSVKNMEESKKFYTEILGFEVICKEDDASNCFLKNGEGTIELIVFDGAQHREDGLLDHLSILVEDVKQAKKELEEKGVQFETDILFDKDLYERGEYFAMFRGPSGERLQIEQIL